MAHNIEEFTPYRGTMFQGEYPTIIELFRIMAHRYPERNCFTVFTPQRDSLTYLEVEREIQRVGSALIEMGIKPDEKVILTGRNSREWAITYLAILWAGGVVVPLDVQMDSDRVLNNGQFSEAKTVFCDTRQLSRFNRENEWVKEIRIITLDKEFKTLKPSRLYEPVPRTEYDTAALLFTSGTTGNEKAVILSNRNIISDAFVVSEGNLLSVDETDILYALLPLHHTYCCTTVFIETFKHGAECVFGKSMAVSRILNDMKRGNITVFMGIPLLYNKILEGVMKGMKDKGPAVYTLMKGAMSFNGFMKQKFNKNPLRPFFNKTVLSQIGMEHINVLICGAGPLAPEVFKRYQQLGLDFLQGYGLTETSPVLTLNPSSHFKIDSIGTPLREVDMIIAEPNEQGIGEIRVKGPMVTKGYFKDPVRTRELFDENGYLKTGDLASQDSEGYIRLFGRSKNLIVTDGGKNVYPEEIEDMFQLYPQIEQIMIRGYQKQTGIPGDRIEAVIYPEKKADTKKINQIVNEVNHKLPGYKKIEKITLLDKPMQETTTRKIKRNTVAR